jgi:membrane-bound lytic murein transglycosylase A
MRRALPAIAAALALMTPGSAKAQGDDPGNKPPEPVQILTFAELDGWADDDHAAALAVFRETCPLLPAPDWPPLCALAANVQDARNFFELFFRPVLVGGDRPALFTGYYEPELEGSPVRTPLFTHPIYRPPPELPDSATWLTRAEIESGNQLAGRGLELAWLRDPVDVFFLQVQGSGRIRLTDGRLLRVGYAGRNGHPYRSVGAELVRRGVFAAHQVSAAVIRAWVRNNPGDGRDLLHHNPSYIFFRAVDGVTPARGPIGAMGRSVTAGRTLAVDPAHTPLGAPVWVEKEGADPVRRLMVAQDTGGAIRGAQRADIFYGTGAAAGAAAGAVRDGGRMMVLLPVDLAYASAPGG